MKDMDTINPANIKSLSTRFHYENNKLFYEIIIYNQKNAIISKHFDDFDKYYSAYEALKTAVNMVNAIKFSSLKKEA